MVIAAVWKRIPSQKASAGFKKADATSFFDGPKRIDRKPRKFTCCTRYVHLTIARDKYNRERRSDIYLGAFLAGNSLVSHATASPFRGKVRKLDFL